MKFTFEAYNALINELHKNDYTIANYHNYQETEKCAILRHDVDYSMEKALEMAEYENKIGVKSTYFVLLTSDFYNLLSKKNQDIIYKIMKCGHGIGLHFDEMRYDEHEKVKTGVKLLIEREAQLLSEILGFHIKSVSMHRPSKETLDADYHFDNGLVNSYGKEFFHEFKYVSDSRMRWRENVDEIINSNQHKRIHILTHAFWYNHEEQTMKKIIEKFINEGKQDRYNTLNDNITDLDSILMIGK